MAVWGLRPRPLFAQKQVLFPAQSPQKVGEDGLLQFTLSSLEARQSHTFGLETELSLEISDIEDCQVSFQVPERVAKAAESQ